MHIYLAYFKNVHGRFIKFKVCQETRKIYGTEKSCGRFEYKYGISELDPT